MTVTVNSKSIRSQLRRFGDGMLLVARSKPLLSTELVRGAALEAEPEESTPWMGSVMAIPAGIVIGLEGPVEDVLAFVEKFAAELGARTDADVTLGAAGQQSRPVWMNRAAPMDDSVSVWMVHTLSEVVADRWVVDGDTTRRLAAAVAREVELPDELWVAIDNQLSLNYAGVSIEQAAPELVRANQVIGFQSGRQHPLAVRDADFLGPGTVSVLFGRSIGSARESVEAGRRLLLASPESEVYGAVVTGRPYTTPERLPLVGRSDYFLWCRFWDRIVPDAYGVQVFGPKHVERLGDLSGWVTTRLDGDRYLVEARDLGAWFEGPTPDPATQAAARRDFAGIIMTADFMEQNPVSEAAKVRAATATGAGTLAGGNG
jgi:hypothetical protein